MDQSQAAAKDSAKGNGIGMRNERSLHAALKQWYAQPGDCFEVPVGGFVIDLVRGEQLVEIQTRNFTAIRQKLQTLVQQHRVHMLHPITFEKWIVQIDKSGGTTLSRRKSTTKGALTDLFEELVRLPELMNHDNFSIEFPLIQEEEVRCKDGKGSKRRKRESLKDRRLVSVVSSRVFSKSTDFLEFLPPSLVQPFSNKCLAQATGLPMHRCRQITYCLRKMDAIVVVGKRGNELLYEW
ncbi:hypothetical protein [Pontibacter virosus]|uniref:DUF8091 domain-containing protein n=1 Tax=Pontibacter virosus TaxID=1765052 RepID=A0A2U1AUY8_9BACT|nr:hypothetical protein [Pontibacter virosus]PVY40245.1 hypothetical protein C8E01_108139 [Pontibacter virosus]